MTAEPKSGGAPAFVKTIQPVSGASAGQLIRLDAKITGSPPIEVQWLRDGEEVVPDITHKVLIEDDVYTLLILEATAIDRGVYDCVATNTAGEARCRTSVEFEPLQVSVQSYETSRATSIDTPVVEPLVASMAVHEELDDLTKDKRGNEERGMETSDHPEIQLKPLSDDKPQSTEQEVISMITQSEQITKKVVSQLPSSEIGPDDGFEAEDVVAKEAAVPQKKSDEIGVEAKASDEREMHVLSAEPSAENQAEIVPAELDEYSAAGQTVTFFIKKGTSKISEKLSEPAASFFIEETESVCLRPADKVLEAALEPVQPADAAAPVTTTKTSAAILTPSLAEPAAGVTATKLLDGDDLPESRFQPESRLETGEAEQEAKKTKKVKVKKVKSRAPSGSINPEISPVIQSDDLVTHVAAEEAVVSQLRKKSDRTETSGPSAESAILPELTPESQLQDTGAASAVQHTMKNDEEVRYNKEISPEKIIEPVMKESVISEVTPKKPEHRRSRDGTAIAQIEDEKSETPSAAITVVQEQPAVPEPFAVIEEHVMETKTKPSKTKRMSPAAQRDEEGEVSEDRRHSKTEVSIAFSVRKPSLPQTADISDLISALSTIGGSDATERDDDKDVQVSLGIKKTVKKVKKPGIKTEPSSGKAVDKEPATGITASVTIVQDTDRRSGSPADIAVQNLEVTEVILSDESPDSAGILQPEILNTVLERRPQEESKPSPLSYPLAEVSKEVIPAETHFTEDVAVDGGVMFRPRTSKSQKSLQTEQEIICLETDLWMCEAFKSSSKPSAVVAQCSTTLFPLKSSLLCQNISCEQEKPFERTAYLLLSAISTSKMCTIRKTPVVSTKQELASCSQWDEKQYETRAAAASIHVVTRRPVVAQHTVALELEDKMRIQSLTTRRAAVSVLIITRRPLRTEEAVAIESADVYQSKSVSLRNAEAVIRLSQHSVGASVSMVQLEKESGFQSAYRNECRGALRHVFQMTRATESTCPTIWEKEDALPAVQTLILNRAVVSVLETHEAVAVLSMNLYQVQSPAATRCASAVSHLNYLSVAKAGQETVFSVAGPSEKSHIQQSAKHQVR